MNAPTPQPDDPGPAEPISSASKPISIGGWVGIVILGIFLVISMLYAMNAWIDLGDTEISGMGWLMLWFGIIFTIACGVVLMFLVFYSARKNYDR